MRYETPELTAIAPSINAVQTSETQKGSGPLETILIQHDVVAAYEDWED